MRFSIVTPVYNAEKYLAEMLDSVFSQSLYDWELLIVDDGSTDNSRSIIEKAAEKDPRVRPVYLEENSGSCFYPRRLAIERSQGDYIVNIDADDIVEKDYLYNLETTLRETGADLVYADMFIFDEENQPVKFIPTDEEVYSQTFIGRSIFNKTLDRWEVSGVAATARSLALLSLQFYDHEFSLERYWGGHHDENLTRIDLYLAEKVAFAHAKYLYRNNPVSITHNISSRRFDLLEADENLCRFTGRYFGTDSYEYKLSHRQLFHHVIEFIRFLNKYPSFENRKSAKEITKRALRSIDFKAIQNIVSPRYFAVLRLGFNVAKQVLAVYERKN